MLEIDYKYNGHVYLQTKTHIRYLVQTKFIKCLVIPGIAVVLYKKEICVEDGLWV